MSARRLVSLALVWLCAVAGALVCYSAPALGQREHVFSSSFGSEGSGDGQFLRPGGLAVSDTTGDVYVIDQGNERVEIFSPTGAYIGQFNGSASPTGAFSFHLAGAESFAEGEIAVDNSTNPLDPSAGDVYVADIGHGVIDKFTPSGGYIGQLTGRSASSPFGFMEGIAVDGKGSLWVQSEYLGSGGLGVGRDVGFYMFNDEQANEYIADVYLNRPANFGDLRSRGFAFDSEGNIYIGHTEPEVLAKFNSAGTALATEVDSERPTGVAVDQSSNDVYIDHGAAVAAFDPSGNLIERFGSSQLNASEGIAVNSSTGTVYASDPVNQAVEIFTAFVVPDASTDVASNLGETSATVAGVANPDGLPVTACVFEYGTSNSYGREVPCAQTPKEIGSGDAPVSVSANLSGLASLTRYHFRLKVANANGPDEGQDRTFMTPLPVAISEEGVSDVSSGSAQFGAQVDPGGSDTTFRFEYGTSVSYGASAPIPDGDLGPGTGSEPVSVRVQGLLAQTTYHVRIAATNVLGTVYGPDETFTTQSAGSEFALPDGRAWEMVSPPNKSGASIALITQGVVEASEAGDAITYLMDAPISESAAGNTIPFVNQQVLSRRETGGGWSTEDIAPAYAQGAEGATETAYRFFSSDLSEALLEAGTTLLSSEATEPTVYLRNDTGAYLPLVTAANVPQGVQFSVTHGSENLVPVTGTPDLSHVLIESRAALTGNALSASKAIVSGRGLYEWSGGRLTLVSVLPDGTPVGGEVGIGVREENMRHAISDDGSRVFWTDGNENKSALGEPYEGDGGEGLYMSDTVTGQTVKVDAPAPGVPQPPTSDPCYQTASASGSKVFFLEAEPLTTDSNLAPKPGGSVITVAGSFCGTEMSRDLYVYDAEAKTLTDLTGNEHLVGGEQAEVQNMVLGASEDGSIVYFIARGKLAEGAQAGQENLYVESETGTTWSAPRLIAVLSPEDRNTWGGSEPGTFAASHDSTAGLASEVSPDGRFLTFMSDRSLTGYDNRDAVSGRPDEEVFLYDEASGHLRCVSCNPTGARPDGVSVEKVGELPSLGDYGDAEPWVGHWLAADIPTWDLASSLPVDYSPYQPRYLSDEGRMFFTSFDSLVAHDTNGKADVYEFEPEGVGSCGQSGGCVSLISSGTSGDESVFLDASGKGPGGGEFEDVFFATASKLTSQDDDTSYDVYDAHVCSQAVPCVSALVSPPECSSGDSCKAAPSLQPAIFGPPASATFSGSGNVQPSSSPVVVSPKKPVKHKKKQKRTRKRETKRSRARKDPAGRNDRIKGKGR